MEKRRLIIGLALLHTAILAAYTLPVEFVPTRLRYWSQAYARALFHQDWRLFSPDPPGCGCALELRATPEEDWQELKDAHEHFIWRRMSANACRYAEALVVPGDTSVLAPIALSVSLERMAEEWPRKGTLHVRIHRTCEAEELIHLELQPHR